MTHRFDGHCWSMHEYSLFRIPGTGHTSQGLACNREADEAPWRQPRPQSWTA